MKIRARIAKAANKENTKTKVVKLDEAQFEELKDHITKLNEWSTNRIVDETKPILVFEPSSKKDLPFKLLRIFLSGLFVLVGIMLIVGTVSSWDVLWTTAINKFLTAVIIVSSILLILVGVDISKEKDRNYLTSLASLLVALVALVIAWIK